MKANFSVTEISIRLEPDLTATQFIDVLRRSTLAERRPVDDVPRMEAMLRAASLVATARDESGCLIGVARALSDFAYCTYLADLAVAKDWQRQGIGRRLIEFVQDHQGKDTTLILLAAPAAQTYYPHIGMQAHESCWTLPPKSDGGLETAT